MSTIWTPSGERPVHRDDAPSPPPQPSPTTPPDDPSGRSQPSEEELAVRMAQVQRELLQTPAVVVIANHCIGLFQLAALHLDQERPDLPQAQLAIDALAAIVEGLGDRLGDDQAPLGDALTSLRLAFVEAGKRAGGTSAPSA